MGSDKLICEQARVVRNDCVGPRLYVIEMESPEISRRILPGQFVHTRVPGMEAHILRRPFSVLDVHPESGTLAVLYQTVGFGSERLACVAVGEELDQIGPIGRGWSEPVPAERVLIVAGGVGAAPLFMQAKALVAAGCRVDCVLGAQTKEALVLRERYAQVLGAEPICATDDGSFGHAGFCTAPAQELLAENDYDRVLCCGPEPLMRIVSSMAAEAGVSCQVSMERRMACGVGACLSCVCDTKDGKKRACIQGPVFDATEVVWA